VGSVSILAELLERHGRRVLLVTDEHLCSTPGFRTVTAALASANARVRIISDILPEPTVDAIENAFERTKDEMPQIVVGVGGGSVIDVAKAICILFANEGPISRYDGLDIYTNRPLPLIAIPSTAGTGSEMSTSLNATDTRRNAKLSIRHRWNRATVAILDPNIISGIPRSVAIFPAIDAVTHALEAYVSREANPLSDAYSLEALRLCGENFEQFLADTSNLEHAQAMQIAAALAGVAFSSARTGYVHCLARAIGGRIKIAHGHACALALPAIVEFNAPCASRRLADVSRLLVPKREVPGKLDNETEAVSALVEYVRGLASRFDFPSKLSSLGLTAADLPAMGAYAGELRYERWNPRPATQIELTRLMESFL
jgi:alcohol dehydrogenase